MSTSTLPTTQISSPSQSSNLLAFCKTFHQSAERRERFFALTNLIRYQNEKNLALERETLSVVEEYTFALKNVVRTPAKTLEELSAKAGVLHVAKRLEFEGADGNLDAAEDEDFLALSLAEDCMSLVRQSCFTQHAA
jgi:hypothetical protein